MQDHASTLSHSAPPPLGSNLEDLWLLDPEITFLNNGSFGAVPREVLASQSAWRERIELRPIEILDRRMPELMAPVHQAVEMFVNAAPTTVGFVTNATTAVNATLRSMSFAPGEKLVATNHVYNAIRKTMQWVARRDGADYVEIEIALPVDSEDALASRVLDALPEDSRLLMIDQISSPTAIRFPLEQILPELNRRGIETVVDGAHAPGMVDVDVQKLIDLGAIAWTGNLHKWAFAPKGTAILHVCDEIRDRIQPTTISHFADEAFNEKFSWQGTADLTPWLSVPDALAFAETTFGWDQLRAHNHAMAKWSHAFLCEKLNAEPLTPLDGSLLGALASVRLPAEFSNRFKDTVALQAALYDKYKIEVPIIPWDGCWLIRVSCQAFNKPEDYEVLADALLEILGS